MARSASANFTAREKRAIWERDGGVCQLERLTQVPCTYHPRPTTVVKWEYHHIDIAAEGGALHNIDNGALLHAKCHTSKYEELHGERWTGARYSQSTAARKFWLYRQFSGGHRPKKAT